MWYDTGNKYQWGVIVLVTFNRAEELIERNRKRYDRNGDIVF